MDGNKGRKVKWTDEENRLFQKYRLAFGTNFYEYLQFFDRTYSQIKSHYHNLERKGHYVREEAPEPANTVAAASDDIEQLTPQTDFLDIFDVVDLFE